MSVFRHSDRSATFTRAQDVIPAASFQFAHDGNLCISVKNTGCCGALFAYFTDGWRRSTILENVLYNLKLNILLIFLANYCVDCYGRQQILREMTVGNGGNLDMNKC